MSTKIVVFLRWKEQTGTTEEIKKLKVPAHLASNLMAPGCCCTLSHDGRWLALDLGSGLTVVDQVTGKEVYRFPRTSELNFLTFSADGQSILTCLALPDEDHQLEVLSMTSGKYRISRPVKCTQPPSEGWAWTGELHGCAISSDGRRLGSKPK